MLICATAVVLPWYANFVHRMPRCPVQTVAMRSAISFASLPVQARKAIDSSRSNQRGQPLRIEHDAFVQVSRVRVEHRRLARDRLDDVRVTMTDVRDVVVRVEIAAAVGVVQPDAFAAHDVQRLVVEKRRAAPEHAKAALEQLCGRHEPPEPDSSLMPGIASRNTGLSGNVEPPSMQSVCPVT